MNEIEDEKIKERLMQILEINEDKLNNVLNLNKELNNGDMNDFINHLIKEREHEIERIGNKIKGLQSEVKKMDSDITDKIFRLHKLQELLKS